MTPLPVVATAAWTALRDAARSAAATRANVSGFRRHPFILAEQSDDDPDHPEHLVVAMSDIDPEAGGMDRLERLALPVLRELVTRSGWRRRDLTELALLLAVPRADEIASRWPVGDLAEIICRRAGMVTAHHEVVRGDRTAMVELLPRAEAWLASGRRRCVIIGVDSWLDPARLRWLDREGRAKSKRNVDGFVPGEAAAGVAIERPSDDAGRAQLYVVGHHVAHEPQPESSGRRSTATAISETLRQAWAGSPEPVRWWLSDLNGESYRAHEWGVAAARCAAHLDLRRRSAPAEALGDVGAATAGLLLAFVEQSVLRGYAPATDALLTCAADDTRRSAVRTTTTRG